MAKKRFISVIAAILIGVLVLSGCGTTSTAGSNATGSASTSNSGSSAQQAPKPSSGDVVIGLSNSFVGNAWRAAMETDFKNLCEGLKSSGKIKSYMVSDANQSVPTQIQQIRNMIQSGVNVLIINAASETGLNSVVDEAVSKGITVVSFDNTVSNTKSINLMLDENVFAGNSAEALAKLIGYKGNVIMVNGVAGTPVSNNRNAIAMKVFQKYPDIKIIAQVNADWSAPIAQQKVASLLTTYPQIDAVWDQGEEAEGVMQAFINAKRKVPPVFVDGTQGALKVWSELMKDGYQTIGSAVPPSEVEHAVYVGLAVKEGKKVKSNPVIVPPAWFTNENVQQYYDPKASANTIVESHVKPSDVDQFFQ